MSASPPKMENPQAQPVLKWAGGKRRLLEQYAPYFPKEFGSYYEPFFGGGAVFFHLFSQGVLQGKRVQLNDINPELVNFYKTVKDECEELISKLETHARRHSEEYYYKVRAQSAKRMKPVNRAARLMYLNRTCFNGLYRVNSKGEFNVPVGRYKNPRINNPEGLRQASQALAQVGFSQGKFSERVLEARAGDLVYFDPPYVPLNTTSSFTSYTRENFTYSDQVELAETFSQLADRGVQVMLSNSDTPLVRELYQQHTIVQVMAPRHINSKPNKRQKVAEVLVLP